MKVSEKDIAESFKLECKKFDSFWKEAGKYIFSREKDGIVIIPPNQVFKVNKSGCQLLTWLKKGHKAQDLKPKIEYCENIACFFKTLRFLYTNNSAFSKETSFFKDSSSDDFSNVQIPVVPYNFDFTSYPVLGEIAVTYACNNRCRFCYAGCNGSEKDKGSAKRLEMKDRTTEQLKKIISVFAKDAKIPFFSFTGGEPLVRKDLEKLVAFGKKQKLSMNLVSNGTLATESRAKSLFKAGLKTAQISVEAPTADLHDYLVGRKGAFEEGVRGIKNLQKAGFSVQTNTTITALNCDAVLEMPTFLKSIGVNRFAMNMYIPSGTGLSHDELFIGYDKIGSVVDAVTKAAQKEDLTFYWYSPTPFCYFNPIARGHGNKSCAASDGLVSVAPNGDVLPCSSWDEPIGNLLTDSFDSVWFSSRASFFKHKKFAPKECEDCSSFTACQGACPLYWRYSGTDLLCKKSIRKE